MRDRALPFGDYDLDLVGGKAKIVIVSDDNDHSFYII